MTDKKKSATLHVNGNKYSVTPEELSKLPGWDGAKPLPIVVKRSDTETGTRTVYIPPGAVVETYEPAADDGAQVPADRKPRGAVW